MSRPPRALLRARGRRPVTVLFGALLVAGSLLSAPAVAGAEEPVAPGTSDGGPAAGQTVVGQLVQAWPEHHDPADAAEHADEGPLSWIETDSGQAVRVDTDDVEDISRAHVGATLSVTVGGEVDDAAAEGLDPAREVVDGSVIAAAPAPAVSPAGTVTHEVTVVMVVPAGATADTHTLAELTGALSGPVARFWSEQSNGAIALHVAAAADLRGTPMTASCSDPYALWNEAARMVGWTPGAANAHLLVYLPTTATACSYGLAEIGSSLSAGGRLYVRDVAPSVMAHELGHNLGLGHSSEYQCNAAVETGTCQVSGYNDWYDVMGYSWDQIGTLNVVQAARLGFLPPAEQVSLTPVSSSTTVTLVPVAAATGMRGVRLSDSSGTNYWLEYRQASGQDAWLGTSANWPGVQAGVTVRRAAGQPDTSLLLDPTPSGSGQWSTDRRAALPTGTPLSLADGAFTVTVLSTTADAAVVQVSTRTSAIGAAYAASGGPRGPLGVVVGPEVCGLAAGGCGQTFQNGSLFWSAATGAHLVRGAIRDLWGAMAAQDSWLGYPTTDEICGIRGGGCLNYFQGGAVLWSPATGVHPLTTVLMAKWQEAGWDAGVANVGYPLNNVVCGFTGNGCGQTFQNGSLFWSAATGAHVVRSSIRDMWGAMGAQDSWLGYPTTDEICGIRGGGCLNYFQGGAILWSPATGVHPLATVLMAKWQEAGWDAGVTAYGYPLNNVVCGLTGNGCGQTFQNGSLFWSAATGAHVVRGPIRGLWAITGADAGWLGYPTGDDTCGLRNGGCSTTFTGGSIYWSPRSGAHSVAGAIRDAWTADGAEAGSLGYPVTDERTTADGSTQTFQGGTLTAGGGSVRRS